MSQRDDLTEVPPAEPSISSRDLQSSAISPTFSQADTLLTRRTDYAANTGGKARQSWRSSINGLGRALSFSSNDSSLAAAPASPGTVPPNSSNHVSPTQASVPAIELPASPVAGPGCPRSFFDSDSESDHEHVIHRASSVRTQRPQLVHHNFSASGRGLRVYGPEGERLKLLETRPGPSVSKAEQVLGVVTKSTTRLVPAEFLPATPEHEDRTEHIDAVEGSGGPAAALLALTANAVDTASMTALAPTPSENSSMSTPPPVVEVPTLRTPITVLDIVPTPVTSFGTLRALAQQGDEDTKEIMPASSGSSLIFGLSGNSPTLGRALNGLRFNPVSSAAAPRLNRAISAPPLPGRHPHRRVTIRPLDLDAAGQYRLHQAIVSTPYPTRNGSIAISDVSPLSALASAKVADAVPPSSLKSDRFPSPARQEALLLELAIARHHSATTLVQIKIEDKSTYDDEALFRVLQQSYKTTLLGTACHLLTARSLSNVTSTDLTFDAPNFVRHLRSPRLGLKRKTWLIWLREQQLKPKRNGSNESEKSTSLYSPGSPPRMPFFRSLKVQPRVTFHFEFSVARIALAVLCTVLMSCLAAILWVVFGVPGFGPGSQQNIAPTGKSWEVDAQNRVLAGLVLAVLVAFLGALCSAGWIAGSYLIL